MLQSFLSSLPFILLRIVIICLEGLTLIVCGYYGSDWIMGYAGNYVSGLFHIMLTPMSWVIGLGVGAFIVKYFFGFIQYYIKLSQIIFLTCSILEYKPTRGSLIIYSFNEAIDNFVYLSINDFTTKTILKALAALKDAIMKNDIMSKFKEVDNTAYKLTKSMALTSLRNVINMTDEIIVSFTWLAHSMYKADRKRLKKKMPGVAVRTKNQAKFILEGFTYLVRVFPKLLINSVAFEIFVFILANISIISIVFFVVGITQFSFSMIFIMLVFYRTLLHIFYYCFVHSFRLFFYLYAFYYELGKLEPFDILDSLSSLAGKIPLLGPLIKKSGQEINPTGSEGEPILEGSVTEILKDNVQEIAKAFNLNSEELLVEDEIAEVSDLPSESEVVADLEKRKQLEKSKEAEQQPKDEEDETEELSVNDSEHEIEVTIEDVEVTINDTTESSQEPEEPVVKPFKPVNPFEGRERQIR